MTPVLAAVHPETLIWIVLLLIGAISSIASKARQARRSVQNIQARPSVQQRREQIREQLAARFTGALQDRIFAQPEAPPVIEPAPAPPAPKPVPPPPIVTAPPPAPHGTPAFRGMFDRGNLVRAVIAAEVLGPPKSLQEQSIWSPRHSEPSI